MPPSGTVDVVCPRCEGRGWLVEEDGGAGTARPCDCSKQDRIPRLLEAARIPPRYRGCNFANFTTSSPNASVAGQLARAKALAEQYRESFLQEDGRFRAEGLLFIGPPGVGKTHLAVAILKELVTRYAVQGLFVDFTSLIHQIQSTFDPGSRESKHQVLDPVMDAELLVLDELGAQKPTAWVNETLYLIMNRRYTRRLPTIFTTNYRLAETSAEPTLDRDRGPYEPELLNRRISQTLVSRLYQMARRVVLEAEDARRQFKSAEHTH